jgi:long-chain fatty acid transport protein
MKKTLLFTLLWLLLSFSNAVAGGYQIRLQGQKQTGVGLIGTPFAYDASSIFYNPGALGLVEKKFSFTAGVSGIMSNAIFQMEGTDYQATTDNPISTPFYAYFSAKIGDAISLGIGAYTPFGSSAKWEKGWAGRYLIDEISLQAIFIQPTVAYHLGDKFGIGAGFIYAIGSVDLTQSLYYNQESSVNLSGDASNIGFNIGIMYKPVDGVTIGIDYRSKVMMEIKDGDAVFTIPSSVAALIPSENKFKTELPLPANLDFGLAMEIDERWTLGFEFNWIMWSAYDSLTFEFEDSGESLNSSSPRNYRNTLIPRIGAEFKLNKSFTFRGGAYYDPSPTDPEYFTPETVSLNTMAFTLGASIYPVDGLSIDLSFLQLIGLKGEKDYSPDNFKGTYKTLTSIPGIGLTYQF